MNEDHTKQNDWFDMKGNLHTEKIKDSVVIQEITS